MVSQAQPILFTADLSDCTEISRLSTDEVVATFVSTLERAGATIVQTCSALFPGTGLTCVLILSESHAVLHTWPETGTLNIDIFSCSSRLKSLTAIDELGRAFGASHVSVKEIPRVDGHRPPLNGRG